MEENKIKVAKQKGIMGKFFRWLLVLATIFLLVILALFASDGYFEAQYKNRIYPGVIVGNTQLGGMTQKEALDIMNAKRDLLLEGGIKFFQGKNEFSLSTEILASDPDLAKNIISVEVEKSIRRAYAVGRKNPWKKNISEKIFSALYQTKLPLEYYIDDAEIKNILKSEFKNLENPSRNAQVLIQDQEKIEVIQEREGKVFDYGAALKALHGRVSLLDSAPIELAILVSRPTIFVKDIEPFVPRIKNLLSTSTPSLLYEGEKWTVTKKQFREWLEVGEKNSRPELIFNRQGINLIFEDIENEITIEPQDAKFELVNGRVAQFQISRDGKKLNREKTYAELNNAFFNAGISEVPIVVDTISANTKTEDANNLGIKELLGVGQSNFAGSPKNRRLNIANGARLLNGILVKPGEEFSLLKVLAPFTAANGYLQELVIKGDRTIPEYGGGLCQIGTTTFRAALQSGLKITERQSHSYRVRYYEPAGMDATIYEPSPDFKFINDTPGHILIITEIQGDELIFKFYGTSDGRVAEVPERAKVYNVTPPGETRYIETEELPPGEKQLVEKPHAGADAEFDYTVRYSDGRVHTETFKSHYVPWRETWLVGKDPNAPTATSTPEILPQENTINSLN